MKAARGIGTLQAVLAVAALGILASLAFAAKSYLAGVERTAHARGVAEERGRWQARETSELTQANALIVRIGANYAAQQARHAEEVNSISQRYQKDLRHAQTSFDADLAAVRAGALRLRDPGGTATACKGSDDHPAPSAAAAAGGSDAARGKELSDQAAEFLLSEASRADALVDKVSRLQDLARSYFKACASEQPQDASRRPSPAVKGMTIVRVVEPGDVLQFMPQRAVGVHRLFADDDVAVTARLVAGDPSLHAGPGR